MSKAPEETPLRLVENKQGEGEYANPTLEPLSNPEKFLRVPPGEDPSDVYFYW
jgi:hypothetical protein